jgi:hypothetical protein
MRFTTALTTVLLSATPLLAAPVPQDDTPSCKPWGCENVTVTEFNLFRDETTPTVQSVNFKLAAEGLTNGPIECTKQNPAIGQDVVRCSGTNYFFELLDGTAETYAVKIYHQLSVGRGLIGTGEVPTICRAGGASRYLCSQPSGNEVAITIAPPPGSTK